MTDDTKKPPAFFCPSCGQKHRTKIDPLEATPGAVMHVACVGCKLPLALRLDGEGALVCTEEEKPSEPPAAAGKPAPAPTPKSAKSKSGSAAPKRSKRRGGKSTDKPAPAPRSANKKAPEKKAPEKKAADKPKADREAKADSQAKADSKAKAAPVPAPRSGADDAKPTEGSQAGSEPTLEGEFEKGHHIGRYAIEEVIGAGGTSTVYRAFDPTTNRSVALKVLAKDATDTMRSRFLREIEVQANIRHQNIMPVFDRGELDDGRPFFTMEKLYKPWTLTDILRRRDEGTLTRYATMKKLDEVENIVRDVIVPIADGIYVANVENGVIHRDLKPDNVLVDSRTLRPYVIDFGICQVLEKKSGFASKAVIPPTGEEEGIVGTPRYLAPEQVKGNVHARTDVWGLGATLFAVIAGEPPLASAQGISKAELKRRIEALEKTKKAAIEKDDERKIAMCDDQLTRLTDPNIRTIDQLFKDARDGNYSSLPQATPTPLRAVVRKAMAVSTSDRYVNARQLATELQAWLGGSRVRALTEAGGTQAAVESARRAVRTHLVTALWLVAGLILGLFLAKGTASIGGTPPSTRVADAESDIQLLTESLDGLGRVTDKLTAVERNRLWTALDATAGKIASRLGDEPAAPRVEAVKERLGFVRSRFAPVRVRIEAPAGTRIEAKNLVTGGKLQLALGENVMPPGRYHVFTSSGVRFPVDVPLIVRNDSDAAKYVHEPAREVLRVPVAEGGVPAGMVYVLGGRVLARDLPFNPPSAAATEIAPFFMDAAEVTNSEYAQFLASLPAAERTARAPEVGFIPDPEPTCT